MLMLRTHTTIHQRGAECYPGGPEGEDQRGQRQLQEEAGVETPTEQYEGGLEWHVDHHRFQTSQQRS